jgi:hypothetical protein
MDFIAKSPILPFTCAFIETIILHRQCYYFTFDLKKIKRKITCTCLYFGFASCIYLVYFMQWARVSDNHLQAIVNIFHTSFMIEYSSKEQRVKEAENIICMDNREQKYYG